MSRIQTLPDGVILTVRTIPRAGRSGLSGTRGEAWLVRIQAPPVDGAANAELLDVLANALEVPRRTVTIVAGEHARLKRIKVTGIDARTARTRLERQSA